MAILGGQVQYVFSPETYVFSPGTCELCWLTYCNRSASEVIEIFNEMVRDNTIEEEALSSFKFLRQIREQCVDIEKYKIFIRYFDDSETDVWTKRYRQ